MYRSICYSSLRQYSKRKTRLKLTKYLKFWVNCWVNCWVKHFTQFLLSFSSTLLKDYSMLLNIYSTSTQNLLLCTLLYSTLLVLYWTLLNIKPFWIPVWVWHNTGSTFNSNSEGFDVELSWVKVLIKLLSKVLAKTILLNFDLISTQ